MMDDPVAFVTAIELIKMYFSMSDPEPNTFAADETHAPAFKCVFESPIQSE